MGGRQPEMQREQRSLGEQSHRHQRGGDEDRGFGVDPLGEQDDVERAIAAVKQRRADEIQDRTEEREQQIAQRGLERLRAAIQ